MQDEAIGWDPMLVYPAPPPFIVRIYALFLLIAVVATLARLVTLWIAAPPFRLSRRANSPIYLHALEASRNHFKQWMACALLGWGIVATDGIRRMCVRYFESKAAWTFVALPAIYSLSAILTGALVVVLFIFLVQWHVQTRIEQLTRLTVSHANG